MLTNAEGGGSAPDAAGLLCRPYELAMRVERTEEAWVRR